MINIFKNWHITSDSVIFNYAKYWPMTLLLFLLVFCISPFLSALLFVGWSSMKLVYGIFFSVINTFYFSWISCKLNDKIKKENINGIF
jgi:hypothetical protein